MTTHKEETIAKIKELARYAGIDLATSNTGQLLEQWQWDNLRDKYNESTGWVDNLHAKLRKAEQRIARLEALIEDNPQVVATALKSGATGAINAMSQLTEALTGIDFAQAQAKFQERKQEVQSRIKAVQQRMDDVR